MAEAQIPLGVDFWASVMESLDQPEAVNLRSTCKALTPSWQKWLLAHRLKLNRKLECKPGMMEDYVICNNINDEAIEEIKELLKYQKKISLVGCPNITDKALEWLAGCEVVALGAPHVAFEQKITDEGLKHLSKVGCVSLTRCQAITGVGLSYLTACTEIYLEMCTRVTDEDLKHLKNCWCVDLANNMRLHSGLQYLEKCLVISLRGCQQIVDDDLAHLTKCEEVDLTNCQRVTDAGLKHLKSCIVLDIPYCRGITRRGCMEHLSKCTVRTENFDYYVPEKKAEDTPAEEKKPAFVLPPPEVK